MKYQNEPNRVDFSSFVHPQSTPNFPLFLHYIYAFNYTHRILIVIVSTLQKIKTAPKFLILLQKRKDAKKKYKNHEQKSTMNFFSSNILLFYAEEIEY